MSEETFERARDRATFRLTYGRTDPRKFSSFDMDGPDLPDAFSDRDDAPGGWHQGDGPDRDDPRITETDWHAHFAAMAINEAVHEALEWFQVDGRPWLNPHGDHEVQIFKRVNELCDDLARLVASSKTSVTDAEESSR